jgi:hypothetical protein
MRNACPEALANGRRMSSVIKRDPVSKVIVVKTADEFMKLLDEFGSFVEIQSHLDLRGLSNTGFDSIGTLNARFAFGSLQV